MDTTGENRHRERMQRKKAVIDARITEATMDKGLLLVLTGNGRIPKEPQWERLPVV